MMAATVFALVQPASAAAGGGLASAGLGGDPKQPIDIAANEAEVLSAKCIVIWRGQAEARQGDSRLRADTLTVYSAPKPGGKDGQTACGAAERIVAEGTVYYVTADENARGDHAVYTAADDLVTLTGDVIVVKGNDVARGERLTINTTTKDARLDASPRSGRVRGVFYPSPAEQKKTSKAAPAPGGGS
jgi:lipopolysaccharide export system protein LptA